MRYDGFTIFGCQYDAVECLTLEQKGELLDMLYRYLNEDNALESEDKEVMMAFRFLCADDLRNLEED